MQEHTIIDLVPVSSPTIPGPVFERDGEEWFSSVEISASLGYRDSKKLANLHSRYHDELADFSSVLNLRTEGGSLRATRVYSEEGVYLLTMFARTDRAKRFRRAFAVEMKKRRLERRQAAISAAASQAAIDARSDLWLSVSRISADRMERIRSVLRYKRMGLSHAEIARILGVNTRTSQKYLTEARRLGLEVA